MKKFICLLIGATLFSEIYIEGYEIDNIITIR